MVEPKIDFAIITAIQIEREAVCKAFQMTPQDRVHKDERTYWRKRLQFEDREFYEIVVTQLPDQANVNAALVVNKTIDDWEPRAVLMVGIAGAAKEEVELGDLVLGREVSYYERGKETVDGTLPEPKYYSADTTLWDRVISVPTWDSPISVKRPDGKDVRPKIHYGVIASSERVIASADIRDEIAAYNRKIAAIEMEGYGVSAATFKQYRPVRCLVIRAISDLADASKKDRWQPYAAAVAAEFTKHFLLDKPLKPQNLPPSTPLRLPIHYNLVKRAIIQGQLIPFLGQGINSCNRHNANSEWQPGLYPPSDSDLTSYLTKQFFGSSEIKCPKYEELCKREQAGKLSPNEALICPLFVNQRLVGERKELPYLAKYIDLIFGSLGLYTELHEIFNRDYQPNQLHQLFAQLPRKMQQKGYPLPYQLIVTTNYDDTLELAFQAIRQPFDLVSYIAKGEYRGKFLHKPYAGKPIVIESPNTYDDFPLDNHPVILKLYGAVARTSGQEDNFVITEDHHMEYLEKVNIPTSLVDLMRENHILFLGFDLSKWKNSFIFRRIWQDRPLDKCKSWVVREKPGKLEKELWSNNNVDIIEIPSESSLEAYIAELNELVQAIPKKAQTENIQESGNIKPVLVKRFDVFLSHNSKEKVAVRQLAIDLKNRQLKVWLDEWELVPGRPWQEALEEIISTTKSAMVLVGKDGLGPWEEPEIRACLTEFVRRKLPVIPVLLPGAAKKPELPLFLQGFMWVDLRDGITDKGLDKLQWGITGQKPGGIQQLPQTTSQ